MTTLVGITAKKGTDGVILASDSSRTMIQWKSQGDVAYKQQTKENFAKLTNS